MQLSNIPSPPSLNSYLFHIFFMHSLRKASQINKRPWMGSIYKQAPSKSLNCSVCFPLLHCFADSRQSAQLCLQQKKPNKEILGPKPFNRSSANTSGPVNFQNLWFWLKMKKGQDEQKTDGWRVWERMTVTEERWLPERFWNGGKGGSAMRNICERKEQIWCFLGIHRLTYIIVPFQR